MIDVRRLRSDPAGVRAAMARRGQPELLDQLDAAVELDREQRDLTAQRDDLRRRINDLSKQVGRLRGSGDDAAVEAAMAQSRDLGAAEADLARQTDDVEQDLRDLLLRIPNVPAAEAPDGKSEDDNVVLATVGYDPDAYGPTTNGCRTGRSAPRWAFSTTSGR